LFVVVCGCTRAPELSSSIDIQKEATGIILVKVKVANLNTRATVPIAVELTGQAQTNGKWQKTTTLLDPAAFVLNNKEQREITKFWRVEAEAVRTTLVIKEKEKGNLLKTQKAEKVFTATAGSPTSQP
jgi:hypothetical protein